MLPVEVVAGLSVLAPSATAVMLEDASAAPVMVPVPQATALIVPEPHATADMNGPRTAAVIVLVAVSDAAISKIRASVAVTGDVAVAAGTTLRRAPTEAVTVLVALISVFGAMLAADTSTRGPSRRLPGWTSGRSLRGTA